MSTRSHSSGERQLEEVSAQVQFAVNNPDFNIQRETILKFASSTDLAVLGCLAYLVRRADLAARITPSFSLDERQSVLLKYWRRCIVENPPDGDVVSGRYVAAMEVLSWCGSLWRNESANSGLILQIKEWLGDLYRQGAEEVRTCIVQGILEHLLQDRDIRRSFADWRNDPVLKEAYQDATG